MLRAVAVIISAAVPFLFLVSCGGEDTVAERSAAAYREALEKGLPIEDDHGGHGAHGDQAPGETTLPAAHEDHGAAGAEDHAMAGHGDAPGTAGEHAMGGAPAGAHEAAGHGAAGAEHPAGHAAAGNGAHGGAQHSGAQHDAMQHGAAQSGTAQHDAMQHGAAQPGAAQHDAMQPGEMQHDAMQPGATGPAEHGGHAGMNHSADAHSAIPPGGLWGRVPGSVPGRPAEAPALPMAPAPATSDEMKRLRPASTLAPDPADTPAAISVQEAKKATGEEDHSAHPPDHTQHDTNEDARP